MYTEQNRMRSVRRIRYLCILALLICVILIYKDFYSDVSTEYFVPIDIQSSTKVWYSSNRTEFISKYEVNLQSMTNGTKQIFWPDAMGWIEEVLPTINFNHCQVKSCEIQTYGKQYYTSSDAIVFDHSHPIPHSVRPHNQIWVYMNMESPIYSRVQDFGNEYWRGRFNWTMTYRLDSDIFLGYGSVGRANTPNYSSQSLDAVIRKKKKLVAWVASHCVTSSHRESYVQELSKHISVDIYGKCGNDPDKIVDDSIFEEIERDYKFYLSFENSVCQDYVTEKFFRVQTRNLVSVVLGGADYSMIYPNDTYINVKDFQSPKTLADRLFYLDQNDSEYKKYLVKKSLFTYLPNPNIAMLGLCEMCARLHQPNIETKIYDNITKWYFEKTCYSHIDPWYNLRRLFV